MLSRARRRFFRARRLAGHALWRKHQRARENTAFLQHDAARSGSDNARAPERFLGSGLCFGLPFSLSVYRPATYPQQFGQDRARSEVFTVFSNRRTSSSRCYACPIRWAFVKKVCLVTIRDSRLISRCDWVAERGGKLSWLIFHFLSLPPQRPATGRRRVYLSLRDAQLLRLSLNTPNHRDLHDHHQDIHSATQKTLDTNGANSVLLHGKYWPALSAQS
jgi:hypothetical protein